ncbi:MAG: flagellar basal body rod C-terminal domain-containing protein [Acidimicrobiales bacterium]|jgi:flagellar basal-body rod protein FlgC
MWDALNIAGSGANVDQTWIDTIGGNVANMEDGVTPGQPVYQAEYPVVTAEGEPGDSVADGGSPVSADGVQVTGVELGPAQGQQEYDPTNPLADAQGEVTYPVVDLGSEMTQLIESQTSYQANSSVMSHATTAYQAILDMKV